MIIAARGRGDTKKNPVEEECHGRLLGKKPGVPQSAQDHVCQDHDAETRNSDPAEDHQKIFERIERPPLKMALLLQYQAVKTHRLSRVGKRVSATGVEPAALTVFRLFYVANKCEDLLGMRPEILGELVLDRRANPGKAALVDVLDDLDAHLLEFRQRLVLEPEGRSRLVLADLVGGRLHPLLLLIGQAAPDFVADKQ